MKNQKELRSRRWFEGDELNAFRHRSRAKQMGYSAEEFEGKPVVAIVNTWSGLNPCHGHFRERAEAIARGVLQAGGFPVELPAISLSETYMKPSPMLYRNLLAMEVEELLRSQPIDGAVLMGGCDKTTPGLLMGATSMDIPAIYVPAGPMLSGNWRGNVLGSGSDQWKYMDEKRAGRIGECEWREIEDGIARSTGHCMTMGTASTMTAIAETLGFTLPGASSIPAVDSNHIRMASTSGRRIVGMIAEDLKPSDLLTTEAFEDAIAVDMALGGSTNAIIHLIAMAGRAGLRLPLEEFDRISSEVPVLANIRPSGKYLMEDFYFAGGLRGLMSRMKKKLHLERRMANGRSLEENIGDAGVYNEDVIRPWDDPLHPVGGTAILRGNLAPNGCVIKVSAADPNLLCHRGKAVVFENFNELEAGIDSEELEVDENSVLILKNSGPLGAPGMPEWGQIPIPKKLLERGVKDMVRISDSRMSGTSYGTCVLHVAPEAHVGGPIAFVRSGDVVELDVPGRRISLLVDEEELRKRKTEWVRPDPPYGRGYGALFAAYVTQADQGCDFDILRAGPATPDPEMHH